MSEDGEAIASVEDLVRYFRSGEKPVERWRVGTEHEKVGIYLDTGGRVPYEGERGIGALLERIAEKDSWQRVREGEQVVALSKAGASITLEPGGQIELSGAPLATARETCLEFNTHVDLVNRLSADLGIVWLGLGIDPLHGVDEIPVMPKRRYEIMREYLPSRGSLALEMMHATATVQANFDYADERDMAAKMRTAMGCTSLVSALFANSSISAGAANGFASRRLAIWRETDPDRCGLLPFVFEDEFGYRDYARWALEIPMFFLIRDDRYLAARGTTFRAFMSDGFEGHHATLADWDTHLTTLFPEVRLKRIIEVRGADAVPREHICALPTLWKGLLYDDGARAAAWELVRGFSQQERDRAHDDIARRGLRASMGGRSVLELARELTDIAAEGLRRIAADRGGDDERGFLDPVWIQLDLGKSPGEVVLEAWQGSWQGSLERLIDYARY